MSDEETDSVELDERTGLKKKPPLGFVGGVMNHIKCCLGSGLFAQGFAYKNAGMALGPPTLILIGLIMLYCQHLLLATGKEVEKSLGRKPDFAETGRGVFEYGPEKLRRIQKFMKFFTNTILVITQTGILCIYVVFFADSMMKVAEHRGYKELTLQVWIIIAFVPILISNSLLGNMKFIGYLSFFSNILVSIGIIFTIYLTTTNIPQEYTFKWIGDMTEFPIFLSIASLACSSIQVVLPLYIESRKPEKIASTIGVLNVSACIEIIVVVLIGVLSYRKYGKDCEGSITLNFETSISAEIAVVCVGIAVMLTYTLCMYFAVDAVFPVMSKKWGPFRFPRLGLFLFKLGYMTFTFILSWILPLLGEIVALVGAFGNTALSIILPPLFHLVMNWGRSSYIKKSKDIFIIVLGIVLMIAGVSTALRDICMEINKIYSPQRKQK